MDRSKIIVRTSIVGIVVNLILVAFKATVGLLTNSIAVILDAVNNLSDAMSSIITIVGTKLSGRRPDKEHPYGYGRIEYLTSVIIAAAVVAKFFTGRYVKKVGESIKSGSLIASGSDAFFDSILSFATLVAAAANMIWGWQLEGVLGVVISLIIIKAGVEMLMETLDGIIGLRADTELTHQIKEIVNSFPGVRGVYDLTLHNYGPSEIIGSAHIEVSDSTTARELHYLTRCIAAKVYAELSIVLTIGIYAASDSSPILSTIKGTAEALAAETPEVLQMHGFYGDETEKLVMFDLIVDFSADAAAVRDAIAALDSDYSD